MHDTDLFALQNEGTERNLAECQPARKRNIEALVSFFRAGCKQNSRDVGIELEHFLVDGTESRSPTASPMASEIFLRASANVTLRSRHIMGTFSVLQSPA